MKRLGRQKLTYEEKARRQSQQIGIGKTAEGRNSQNIKATEDICYMEEPRRA
jgi:hypothetical protein